MTVVAAVLPAYRSRDHISGVLGAIRPNIAYIFVVDDACPENTGSHVRDTCADPRVRVIFNEVNQGVGGAVMAGYRAALETDAEIFVKIDSDGQMDPALVDTLTAPIRKHRADYAKGNRFYHRSSLRGMPKRRLIGNAGLSFLTKLSSGYWNVMDPTNGFAAIHRKALAELDLERIDKRYFFESDMLHHLNLIQAVVQDVPMQAKYADETSSLRVSHVLVPFFIRNLRNTVRRVFYDYLLRNFSVGSTYLLMATGFLTFGSVFGSYAWLHSIITGIPATTGTVILAALPIIIGFQAFSGFLNYDVANVPRVPLQSLSDD